MQDKRTRPSCVSHTSSHTKLQSLTETFKLTATILLAALIVGGCASGDDDSDPNPFVQPQDDLPQPPNMMDPPIMSPQSTLVEMLTSRFVSATDFDVWFCTDAQGGSFAFTFLAPDAGQTSGEGFELDAQVVEESERIRFFDWEVNGADGILIDYRADDRLDDITSIAFDNAENFRTVSTRHGSLQCALTTFNNTVEARIANQLRDESDPNDDTPLNETIWACTNNANEQFSYVLGRRESGLLDGVVFLADDVRLPFEWESVSTSTASPLVFDGIDIEFTDSADIEELRAITFANNDSRFSATSSVRGAVSCDLRSTASVAPPDNGQASELALADLIATVDPDSARLDFWNCINGDGDTSFYTFESEANDRLTGFGAFGNFEPDSTIGYAWVINSADSINLDFGAVGVQEDLTTIRFSGNTEFTADSSINGQQVCSADSVERDSVSGVAGADSASTFDLLQAISKFGTAESL